MSSERPNHTGGENDKMDVKVRFRGPISKRLVNPLVSISIGDSAKIRKALQMLLENEEAIRKIWTDVEKIDREAMILANDVDIGLTGGLDSLLHDGDEIVILPLVHGG
jgi:molybdopterin converting factor small subunit